MFRLNQSIATSEVAWWHILDHEKERLLLRWIEDRLKANGVGGWCDGTVEATLLMQPSVHHWALGICKRVSDLPLLILLRPLMSLQSFDNVPNKHVVVRRGFCDRNLVGLLNV